MLNIQGKSLLAAALMASAWLVSSPALSADAKDIVLKDDAKCTRCHDEADAPELLRIGKTKHGTRADSRTPTCVSCHGESKDHAAHEGATKPPKVDISFGKKSTATPEARNDACLTCHQKDSSRHLWAGSVHDTKGVTCASCHNVHNGHDKVRNKKTQPEVCFTCHKQQRIEVNKPSHHPVMEGKVACSDCHNSHGSAGPKLMKRDTVVDTCYTCHMEKRGPFVHNHEPVNEDCGNCHNPHGTTAESMLKVRAPFLCHQCHTPHGGFIPQLVGSQITPNTATAVGKGATNMTQGRSCMNCHTQVHGSNNPAATNPTPQFNFR